jgi:large subunit ribosomal protein L18
MAQANRFHARHRRHRRVRKNVAGTSGRPRLNVFRSASHIYAQVIDDDRGVTLAAASSLEEPVTKESKGKDKKEVAGLVGGLVASRAVEKGVKTVVFDRGGYRYFGRVLSLAEGARKGGLEF